MDGAIVLGGINAFCILILIIVSAFLFIEYKRFKHMEDQIIYYLNKNGSVTSITSSSSTGSSTKTPSATT